MPFNLFTMPVRDMQYLVLHHLKNIWLLSRYFHTEISQQRFSKVFQKMAKISPSAPHMLSASATD